MTTSTTQGGGTGCGGPGAWKAGSGTHGVYRGGALVADFTQHQIERALRHRVRYRYVRTRVARESEGYRIESPCCSRNVAPRGGLIDSATDGLWHPRARDHAARHWVEACTSHDPRTLLDLLCVDAARAFWP